MRRLVLYSCVMSVWLAGVAGVQAEPPASRPVGSAFGRATRGEQALAAGKALRGPSNDFEAEGAHLIQAFVEGPDGDEDMDAVALRLAEFAPNRDALREQLLGKCTRDQLARLVDRAKSTKEFRKQILFGEEFLERFAADEKQADMKNDVAFAHMMRDGDEEEALAMWEEVTRQEQGRSAGTRAAVQAEAVKGPQSIAALEAAFEMAQTQLKAVRNPYRSQFSFWRVIDASKRPFFQEYMAHPDIPAKDKASLLYKVMYSYYRNAVYSEVPALATEIYELVGFDNRVAESAAFCVGLSYWLGLRLDDGAREFEQFLRVYPNSHYAPDAGLYMGLCLQEKMDIAGAMLQFGVTAEMYPNSDSGKKASSLYRALMDGDLESGLQGEAARRKPSLLERLKTPLDPATIWAAKPKPEGIAAPVAPGNEPPPTPANDPRFKRLTVVLAGQ